MDHARWIRIGPKSLLDEEKSNAAQRVSQLMPDRPPEFALDGNEIWLKCSPFNSHVARGRDLYLASSVRKGQQG